MLLKTAAQKFMKRYQRSSFFLLTLSLLVLGGWLCFQSGRFTHRLGVTRDSGQETNAATFRNFAATAGPTSQSELVFPTDAVDSSHPVERAIAQGVVREEKLVRLSDGKTQRLRLVRSALMENPLVADERWRQESGKWVCESRELFVANQLILQLRAGVSSAVLAEVLGRSDYRMGEMIAPDICTVRLPGAGIDSWREALAYLSAQSNIIMVAEGDGVGFGSGVPNDPDFASQWGLHNTGQSGGSADADVDAPELWDVLQNTPGIVVAVLDSGLNFTHPDLQGIAWTNSAEIAGDGLDNDGNGRIDDVRGWDFTNGDNDPTDDHGHGSNVSGIIAANRNNGVGVAGLIGGVKILVCKVLNSSNAGLTSHLIAATTYARQMGVPIMNLSLQNYPFNTSLNSEFNACQSAGVLLSICAGNQGVNNDVTPNYPSCHQQTNIIAVGNHDRTDVRWSGTFNPSNYGATNVDLYAPGHEILSPVLGTAYGLYTGTSQAAPHVTAVAAMLKYLNPTWSAAQIKSNIMSTVVSRPAYSGNCVSGGRLNAVTSLAAALAAQPQADRDGDGFSSLMEYLAGTRLDESSSKPALTNWLSSGYLHFSIARVARPEGYFELVTSTNLINWTAAGITDLSTSNLLHGMIPVGNASAAFLKLQTVMNP